jgi:hypothetical protein
MHVTTAAERQNPTHSRPYPLRAPHLGTSWESRASCRGGEVLATVAYLSHGALALNRRASRGLFAGGLPNIAVKHLKSSSGRVKSRLSSRTGFCLPAGRFQHEIGAVPLEGVRNRNTEFRTTPDGTEITIRDIYAARSVRGVPPLHPRSINRRTPADSRSITSSQTRTVRARGHLSR